MVIVLLSLILSFLIISNYFFINGATKTENEYATVVMQNTITSLQNDLNALNNTANDWSHYDNAYSFVKNNNSNFKERSLLDATFLRLNINAIIFTNTSGDIIFAKAVDLQSKKEIPLYQDLYNVTKNYIMELQDRNVTESSGFVYINGRPLMVVSKPVLKSDGTGPSPGYMIMGRYLDTYALNSLPQNANLTITPINTVTKNILNTSNFSNSHIILKTESDSVLSGYSVLNGTTGKPSLILKVDMPRTIYNSSQKTVWYLVLSLLISGLVASFLIYYFLDHSLLRRLEKINDSVLKIGRSNDLSGRVPVLGDDELADEARSVNEMLESLEKSNIELENSKKEINESLKEKEVLLREIHHRVKNNLQIISVLLSLQSDEIDDPLILEKYKESENRIHAMALIHERMYQSEDLSSIDFSDYLQNLVSDIIYVYGFDTGTLELNLDVEKYNLSIETVMPMGLIINELISNSLKYAFKDQAKNRIDISFKKIGDNNFKLEIKDNGKGLPEGFDIKDSSTLGMQLVQELVEQIEGSMTMEENKGTHFIIHFKDLEYKKRI